MRNTSYRELWENVSLDRSIRCKLYANEVRTRLTIKLLSNLRWLETVSSTFQDLEFDGSLQPLYTC